MIDSTQCIAWVLLVYLTAGLVKATDTDSSVYSFKQDFATALYSELAKGKNSSNIFFSPLSIHVILALAYVGAGGQTAQEMATGLRLPVNVDVVKTGFHRLLQGMNLGNSVNLEIANKIYLAKNYYVKDEFKKVATKNFFAEVQNVDFSLGAETVRIINEWVKNKTHDKIKDIISAIDPLSKLVLVNAANFKGKWKTTFESQRTTTTPFYITPNETKNVEMMFIRSHFPFVRSTDIGADILELDFIGNTTSLVIILPFTVDGLPEVENMLGGTTLTTIFESLTVYWNNIVSVRVQIPKFKLEQSVELNDYLKALGMSTMFEDNADFSPMSDSGSSVSEVLHKAFIEVNEEGTEAAAATVAMVMGRSHFPTLGFLADHPFMFILRCKISGAVLFMGRFSSPQ